MVYQSRPVRYNLWGSWKGDKKGRRKRKVKKVDRLAQWTGPEADIGDGFRAKEELVGEPTKELQWTSKIRMGTRLFPAYWCMPGWRNQIKKQIYLHHKSQFRASNKLSLHIYRAFMFQLKIIYFRTCGSLSSGTILAARSLFCSVVRSVFPGVLALPWGPEMVLSYSHQLHLLHHVLYSMLCLI